MTLPRLDQLRPFALPAAMSLAAAVVGYAASGALAVSDEADDRKDRARARLELIEARLPQLLAQPAATAVLCELGPAAAETALEGRLSEAAVRTGAVWEDTMLQTDSRDGYSVVSIRTAAHGPYEVVVQALAHLTETGPSIFVERLEIQPASGGVRLELEGSQLCLMRPS